MNILASFPGRSHLQYLIALQYLHTVSDQILEVGTAWERGYEHTVAHIYMHNMGIN